MGNYINPFSVETPEQMSAKEINDLFVPHTESFSLESKGHIFLHGHRGCGKSMMLRRLSPDCQLLDRRISVNELPFFGVYISIKKTDIDIIDFNIIDNESSKIIIAEHVMVCYFLSRLFNEIKKHCEINSSEAQNEIEGFIKNDFFNFLIDLGFEKTADLSTLGNRFKENKIEYLINFFNKNYNHYVGFLKKLLMGFNNKDVTFDGPIFGFYDLLLPIIEKITTLSFMPSSPIYFLVDDADNLNFEQTKILNSWVSYRTTDCLSFKISTQMKYKTYQTQSGRRIETPHDYKELTYSKIQTGSSKDKYSEWVYQVTSKRLELFKISHPEINSEPKEFFPEDAEQAKAIKEIYEKYQSGEYSGSSSRNNDNAYRYARPDYIKSLGGKSKNRNSYKYAGFEQLVHVSSGVIRYFLDSASKMFAMEMSNSNRKVKFISPSTQNTILRDEADKILFSQIDKMDIEDYKQKNILKLRGLINCIGSIFYTALISDGSERKYFSFIISDPENISNDLQNILNLGIQEGLIFESYIGTKEGLSRTKLYVMTRRLAPYFNIDPMGFSGYKSIRSDILQESINNPKKIINKLKRDGIDFVDEDKPIQGALL